MYVTLAVYIVVSVARTSKSGSFEIIFPPLSNHSNSMMLSPVGVNLQASLVTAHGVSDEFRFGGTYPCVPRSFCIPIAAVP